jgi:hypothetical protein
VLLTTTHYTVLAFVGDFTIRTAHPGRRFFSCPRWADSCREVAAFASGTPPNGHHSCHQYLPLHWQRACQLPRPAIHGTAAGPQPEP